MIILGRRSTCCSCGGHRSGRPRAARVSSCVCEDWGIDETPAGDTLVVGTELVTDAGCARGYTPSVCSDVSRLPLELDRRGSAVRVAKLRIVRIRPFTGNSVAFLSVATGPVGTLLVRLGKTS
jgi:hypothetical protein